jgi:hypothetical protein
LRPGACGILFAFDSVVFSIAMPMMFNDHNFLVMSVPVAVVIKVFPYDYGVFGIRRSVRKSDRENAKSNNSQNKISHFVSSQSWMSSRR